MTGQPPAPKRPTMADVARAAGTSTAVVSYVLNPGSRPVAEETRARVLAAVEALDYRPDRNARALRRRHTWRHVGLLVPDVTLPLYGSLVGHLEREARRRHHLLVTGNTGFEPEVERELVRGLLEGGIDALVVANPCDTTGIAGAAAGARIPLAWLHHCRDVGTHPLVGADHTAAGELATRHLVVDHQCRRVAFVGGFEDAAVRHGDRETVRDRHTGYRRAVSEAGLEPLHVSTDLSLEGAYAAVRDLVATDADLDGVVVGTYGQSAAALRALTDAGRRVPGDVSVIAFDGDPRNRYEQIVLSTVQQEVVQIAAQVLDIVVPTSPTPSPTPRQAPAAAPTGLHLVTGESCGCPRAAGPQQP